MLDGIKVSFVVAMNSSKVIGMNNQLPWNIPSDLNHFKELTANRPVVMGRGCFESIGRPLPNRENIVLSGSVVPHSDQMKGAFVYDEIDQVVGHCKSTRHDEMMIIGGESIYNLFYDVADNLFITWVTNHNGQGDRHFSSFQKADWVNYYSSEVHKENGNFFYYQTLIRR